MAQGVKVMPSPKLYGPREEVEQEVRRFSTSTVAYRIDSVNVFLPGQYFQKWERRRPRQPKHIRPHRGQRFHSSGLAFAQGAQQIGRALAARPIGWAPFLPQVVARRAGGMTETNLPYRLFGGQCSTTVCSGECRNQVLTGL